MRVSPADTKKLGSASAAFLVSKMMASSRTRCAICLSCISAGLRPDLRRISSHSGEMVCVWKLPCLSMATELDLTTYMTTDSSLRVSLFLKMFLILPKKEFSFLRRSSSSTSRLLISSRAYRFGAYCSTFTLNSYASSSLRNWMQMVPNRQRSKPQRLSLWSFCLQLSRKPQQSSTSSSRERCSMWQKRRKWALRWRSQSRCSKQIWVEQRRRSSQSELYKATTAERILEEVSGLSLLTSRSRHSTANSKVGSPLPCIDYQITHYKYSSSCEITGQGLYLLLGNGQPVDLAPHVADRALLGVDQSVPLGDALPHLQQAVFAPEQDGLVLVVPEVHGYLLPLQEAHLPIGTAPDHCPVAQLEEEVLAGHDHLQDFEIEAVDLDEVALVVDGEDVLEGEGDEGGGEGVGGEGELDALDAGDMVQPDASACEQVRLQVVADAQVVVLVTHEDRRPLLDGDVALVRSTAQVVDQHPFR